MDRVIANSTLSLNNFYEQHPALGILAINHFQLLTAVWNIFLAMLPLVIFLFLKKYWRHTKLIKLWQRALALVLFVLWFLFLPNAAYVIADVSYLLNYCPANSVDNVCLPNAWMIMFFFSYAAIGWVAFYYLLKLMADLIGQILNARWSKFFLILVIPTVALGLLFGLINRLNSWDVFFYPVVLLKITWLYLSQFNYFINWAAFSLFLYLLYFAGDAIFKKLKH